MNSREKQKITLNQVARKLESLRPFLAATSGINSWSKYLREALGMSLSQMAKRMKLAQSTMSESEKQEAEGRLTINKLKKMAVALDCELVYAFVPTSSLQKIIEKQAKKKVEESMKHAETHMSLEDQTVTANRDDRIQDLIEEKMYSKYLWDD